MKISIGQNSENSPVLSFTKMQVHRTTRVSQLHQVQCDLDLEEHSNKVLAAYSLAEALIMINMAVQFAHNESHKNREVGSLLKDFDNLRSSPIDLHAKDPLCGKPPVEVIQRQNFTGIVSLGSQHQLKQFQTTARNDFQFKKSKKKCKSSLGFFKLDEKIDTDPIIEKLREKKIKEFEKQANLDSKKKNRKDVPTNPHRKLSSNRFTSDYDGTRMLCSSQFKKRNLMQLIPVSLIGGPKVVSKSPNQTFQSRYQQQGKVINKPVRVSVYEHRNQYIHQISNQLNIPVQLLLQEEKAKVSKKGSKKPVQSPNKDDHQNDKPTPQKPILTRDQRRNRNLIKVSSLWKEQMQEILEIERMKNGSHQGISSSTTSNPTYNCTPNKQQSDQQIDAATNFDILILTANEWGGLGKQKEKSIHNPSSFKLKRQTMDNLSNHQNNHRTLKRTKMQQIDLVW